jgi:hypothetical protein
MKQAESHEHLNQDHHRYRAGYGFGLKQHQTSTVWSLKKFLWDTRVSI